MAILTDKEFKAGLKRALNASRSELWAELEAPGKLFLRSVGVDNSDNYFAVAPGEYDVVARFNKQIRDHRHLLLYEAPGFALNSGIN